jgi:hypothetical protein
MMIGKERVQYLEPQERVGQKVLWYDNDTADEHIKE